MDAARRLTALLFARPVACALAAGAAGACGFQPLTLWPLTLLALAVLIELTFRAQSWKRAALVGWAFGLAHFTVGNYWIATAFTYQANMPHWLGSIAVVLLSFYLAVYPALATLGAWLLSRSSGPAGKPQSAPRRHWVGLALAGCWIISEWLRSWVFTGFAWNPLGVALLGPFDSPGLGFLARWIGTYGLSGVAVLLAWALHRFAARASSGAVGTGEAIRFGATAVLLVALVYVPIQRPAESTGFRFTLVQPDIRQEVLDDPTLFETHFLKTARLTLPRVPGRERLVLWPESGIPDYLRDGYPHHLYRQLTYEADPQLARKRIGRVIGPGSLLLTGAVDVVIRDGDSVAARNSITAIDSHGHILAGYAKAHLVPYGEYLALRPLLEPLGASRLVAGSLDFWPGPGPRTYDFGPWGKAGMQICYEIIFSGQVVDPRNRPDYIFNPSNDGWFGSWGPPQHLAQARLRAIEEGLPVLRATTTGISAVIDPDGIVRQHVPRHIAARIDGTIPAAYAPPLFARMGNLLPLGFAALLLAFAVVAMRRSTS
ncbi:MAG: apolipoprotein N-acyltransferase [Novosphingobium sp.]|nr:apolipoprotein N-acyltransferase [Novosphingobium sp.]MCP5401629.1 apolipoprotein N-acyltransferase [Novosphingobium sp.]